MIDGCVRTRSPVASKTALPRRTTLFLVTQMLTWPTLAAAAFKTRLEASNRNRVPNLRSEPFHVAPLHELPELVTDEQLRSVLGKLRLGHTSKTRKINHIDHALRLWGNEIAFSGPYLSGQEMLDILTDDRALRNAWGRQSPPLLIQTPTGLRVRTQEGNLSSSHVDHTLATLAEVGLPLNFRLTTRAGNATAHDLVEHAVRTFSLNQREYEWTVLALALYATDDQKWCTREGQEITFDRLASRMLRERLGHGVCYGGHRLLTLTVLLRIDTACQRLFSADMRSRIERHLLQATRTLVATQHSKGYWDDRWSGQELPIHTRLQQTGSRLLATGHALEWWALTGNRDLLPPREVLVRAGQWVTHKVESMGPRSIEENYTFLTHAGRALSLWRREFPAESWQRLNHFARTSLTPQVKRPMSPRIVLQRDQSKVTL